MNLSLEKITCDHRHRSKSVDSETTDFLT